MHGGLNGVRPRQMAGRNTDEISANPSDSINPCSFFIEAGNRKPDKCRNIY